MKRRWFVLNIQSFMLAQSLRRFPAVLRSPSGEQLAEGTAQLAVQERTITFRSDFVPLYPLGTPLEVFRVNEGKEIHRFWGKVYISDRQLLRLVDIDDELLPGSELVYCSGLPFTATACLRPLPAAPKRTFFFRREPEPAPPVPTTVAIPEMTDTQLVLLYDSEEVLEPGRIFDVTFDAPLSLPPLPVELIRSGLFAAAQPRLCRLPPLTETDRKNLCELLAACNQKNNKLF